MQELRENSGRADAPTPEDEFRRIPLNLIDSNPEQPRRRMNGTPLQELTDSVRQHGVLQPIRVRRRDERYEIIAGHRRVQAARRAGMHIIPAVVVCPDDAQVLVEALVENIQRDDLNHVERGESLRRLRLQLRAKSWEEVGRAIGISRRHVYHLLNVVQLPEPIREDVEAGIISEKHCRALMRLQHRQELQLHLWHRITAERMSGDEALHQAREMLAQSEAGSGTPPGGSARRLRTQAAPEHAVDALLRWLPRASVKELRPLRRRLDALRRQLCELMAEEF